MRRLPPASLNARSRISSTIWPPHARRWSKSGRPITCATACSSAERSRRRVSALRVQACVAGGGPAGMMLGLLLARAGVRVAVLEKHADFLRDFRGDTIHPSTLDV